MRREVFERVEADVKAGFKLTAHLHNHPFMFDRVVGDRNYTITETVSDVGGALAPSVSDAAFYRMQMSLGLQQAWVTNGFESVHIDRADIDELFRKSDAI